VFELDDKVVESVIFAMENQGAASFINLDTGLLSSRADGGSETEEPGEDGPDLEPVPTWTSQDGFRLMEQFAQTIGHPVVRADLLAALSRGRGVFRAFKNALDTHPEAERKWYEYKARAMKARIVQWYEDLRDVRGLQRLGLEPEDTDDLLLSDFRILRYGAESWGGFEPLVRAGREDALARFPACLVDYVFSTLDRELAGPGSADYSLYSAECEPGARAGMALARALRSGEGTFSVLGFLYVDPERRRIGLGRTLIERARQDAFRDGIRHFVVDMPFLWPEFGASLEGLGYSAFGTRWLSSSDS
jgi:GNAT superfamily N-acetyltransferase